MVSSWNILPFYHSRIRKPGEIIKRIFYEKGFSFLLLVYFTPVKGSG